jgi:hypothetical protein
LTLYEWTYTYSRTRLSLWMIVDVVLVAWYLDVYWYPITLGCAESTSALQGWMVELQIYFVSYEKWISYHNFFLTNSIELFNCNVPQEKIVNSYFL